MNKNNTTRNNIKFSENEWKDLCTFLLLLDNFDISSVEATGNPTYFFWNRYYDLVSTIKWQSYE